MGGFNIFEQFNNYLESEVSEESLSLYWESDQGRKEVESIMDEVRNIENGLWDKINHLASKIDNFVEMENNE